MSKRIQLILLVFVALAGTRIFLIHRARNAPAPAPKTAQPNPNFSADNYVVPTQVHSSDFKSAKEDLIGKTVWVRAGNQVFYYPYTAGRVDFKRPAGLLPPLEKLAITSVIQTAAPDAKTEEIAPGVRVRAQQVMVVFHADGESKTYASPIGSSRGGDYTFYINDTFFFDDPHQLYKHWPADVWTAIDQHQVKPGMNELQVALAIGAGVPQGSGGDFGNRTLRFDNNGHPVTVTFERNRVTEVHSAGS